MPTPKLCRVGVTCDFEVITCRRGLPSPRYVVPEAYIRAVSQVGGLAIMVPHQTLPENSLEQTAAAVLQGLDALVVSGGDFDVPPTFYGQAVRPGCRKAWEARSLFERALLRAALARDMPILGVCGGMQLLNVTLGGTLFQDLSERPSTAVHEQPQDRVLPHHALSLLKDSHLHRALGDGPVAVNSTHHQMVDQPGKSVRVVATAPDGVTEAIEVGGQRFAVGVQWHPEIMGGTQWEIYRALVQAAGQAGA
jgi:putative glutamine amidotransferase